MVGGAAPESRTSPPPLNLGSLPEAVYFDVMAITDLARVGALDAIAGLMMKKGSRPTVEISVRDEAVNRTPLASALIGDALERNGFVVKSLAGTDPETAYLATRLARKMRDRIERDHPGARLPKAANLGEAATMAMIAVHDPQALFVTADQGAITVAGKLGVAVARPLTMVGLIGDDQLPITAVWAAICDTRTCPHDTTACRASGSCPDLILEHAAPGVFGPGVSIRDVSSLRRTIHRDLAEAGRSLARRPAS